MTGPPVKPSRADSGEDSTHSDWLLRDLDRLDSVHDGYVFSCDVCQNTSTSCWHLDDSDYDVCGGCYFDLPVQIRRLKFIYISAEEQDTGGEEADPAARAGATVSASLRATPG